MADNNLYVPKLPIRIINSPTKPFNPGSPIDAKDVNRKNLKLIGSELISILNIEKGVNPSDEVTVEIKYASGEIKKIKTLCRIDTKNELEYYKNGGILQYVLRNMI